MSGEPSPLLVAHRAGNDVEALHTAERAGADVVEADLWYYRGRLEVRHLKTAGPLPILWDRWRLVPGWRHRLTLSELAAALGPSTTVMLDLKGGHRDLPELTAATMERHAPGRRYLVCSQWWESLAPFREVAGAGVVHSVGNVRALASVAAHLTWHDRHAISIHQKLLDADVVARLREHAPLVMSWPVNDAGTLERLTGWGVNGVISDNLDLICRTAKERAGAPPALP